MRFTVNLYGAPALSYKDFAGYKQDLIAGVALQVTAPLGQYDEERAVNLGTNRWSFKPEMGVSKEWKPWTLEFEAGVTFYTTNHDFFGGKTREQDPLYSTQLHLIREFPHGIWGALSTTYYEGGRTTVDGDTKDDRQENWRYGLTLALPVNRHHSIKLYGTTGGYSRTGTDFDVLGVAWQYRWGGGY
jgi:hypothetical protein